MSTARRGILLFAALLVLSPAILRAQDEPLESLLPSSTVFYVSWHGDRGLAAHRDTNSVLSLWNDPALASARTLFAAGLFTGETKELPPLTREEVTQLLGNRLLAAAVRLPPGVKPHEPATPAKPGAAKKPGEDWGKNITAILIYDRTGRETLVDRLMQWETAERATPGAAAPPGKASPAPSAPKAKPAAAVTKTTFRGVTVEQITRGAEDSGYYRAVAGHYFVQSPYREVVEEWIGKLGSGAPARGTLYDSAAYRPARERLDPNAAAALFFDFHAVIEAALAEVKEPKARQAIEALHLDRFHSLTGSLAFADPATHLQFSLLGDFSPGSLMDLIGTSRSDFPTLEAAPAKVFSYSTTRIDLSALYRMMRSLFSAFAPAGQDVEDFNRIDTAITAQLGMSLQEILKLLSGDFTFVKQESGSDESQNVFLLGVEKPADVVHVLELMLSSQITNEEQLGGITYLSMISPVPSQPVAAGKPAGKKFYYVAVGPKLLVVAPRKATAKAYIQQLGPGKLSDSLASDGKFIAARARLPKDLSTLNYVDISRVNWKEVLDQLAAIKFSNVDPARIEELKKMVPTDAFARHLHLAVGGMWKDRQGLYYDGYIE